MKISLIVAMAANGTIGRDGGLPWRLPADLKRFKRLTMGHHVLFGRKTWESIGRPLPGRRIVVITRDKDYAADGVQIAHSLDEALALAQNAGEDEVFVGGGAEIYRLALSRVERIYLTEIRETVDGDTLFPEWDRAGWELIRREDRVLDERHSQAFSFLDYRRAAD